MPSTSQALESPEAGTLYTSWFSPTHRNRILGDLVVHHGSPHFVLGMWVGDNLYSQWTSGFLTQQFRVPREPAKCPCWDLSSSSHAGSTTGPAVSKHGAAVTWGHPVKILPPATPAPVHIKHHQETVDNHGLIGDLHIDHIDLIDHIANLGFFWSTQFSSHGVYVPVPRHKHPQGTGWSTAADHWPTAQGLGVSGGGIPNDPLGRRSFILIINGPRLLGSRWPPRTRWRRDPCQPPFWAWSSWRWKNVGSSTDHMMNYPGKDGRFFRKALKQDDFDGKFGKLNQLKWGYIQNGV